MPHPVEQILPDENGLSVDSLRGSHNLIRVDLVDNPTERRDPYTQQVLTRGELSTHELSALHNAGVLLDSSGNPLEGDDLQDVPTAYRPDPNRLVPAPVSPPSSTPVPPPGYVYVDGAYMHVDDYYAQRRDNEAKLDKAGYGRDDDWVAESIPPARVGAPVQEPTTPNPEDVRPFGAPDPSQPEPPKVAPTPHPTPVPHDAVPPQPAPPSQTESPQSTEADSV